MRARGLCAHPFIESRRRACALELPSSPFIKSHFPRQWLQHRRGGSERLTGRSWRCECREPSRFRQASARTAASYPLKPGLHRRGAMLVTLRLLKVSPQPRDVKLPFSLSRNADSPGCSKCCAISIRASMFFLLPAPPGAAAVVLPDASRLAS